MATTLLGSQDEPEHTRTNPRARPCQSPQLEVAHPLLHSGSDPLASIIERWLSWSYPPASAQSTATIYRKLLLSLRASLQQHGLDLNSSSPQLPALIETWATGRTPTSRHQGTVAPTTYNQRLAAVTRFYAWIHSQHLTGWPHPTETLSRPVVHKYRAAKPLDVQQVRRRLNDIDRQTPRGMRDYALLQVALNTGRSARQLASLQWDHLALREETLTLTFEGGRTGKLMHDTLDPRLSRTLLDYLHTIYGLHLHTLAPETPIWISFSDRTQHQAIGPQTIADICLAHLGASKTQQLRHTFALVMHQLGAPLDTIQTRLGHQDRSTTDVYLANLKQAHNPYAQALALSPRPLPLSPASARGTRLSPLCLPATPTLPLFSPLPLSPALSHHAGAGQATRQTAGLLALDECSHCAPTQ